MSRPGFSRSPIAAEAVRQKLNELDALIQQMLSLPVNRLDPDWPASAAEPPNQAEPPTPGDNPPPTSEPLVEPAGLSEATAPGPPQESREGTPCVTPSDSAPAPAAELGVSAPAADRETQPPEDGPIEAPASAWFTSLLGWTGIGCLLAALAWAFLDWMGWIG